MLILRRHSVDMLVSVILLLLPQLAVSQWVLVEAGDCSGAAFASDSSNQTCFLGIMDGGFWVSTDGGEQWTPSNSSLDYSIYADIPSVDAIDVYDANADTIVMFMRNHGAYSRVQISYNGGLQWERFDENFATNNDFLAINRADPDYQFYLSTNEFARSFDGGDSWEVIHSDQLIAAKKGLLSVDTSPSDLFYWFTYDTLFAEETAMGLVYSGDYGETWAPLIDFYELYGLGFAAVLDFDLLSNGVYIANVLAADDDQADWAEAPLLVSSDSGSTWTRTGDELPDTFFPSAIVEDLHIPGRLYTFGGNYYGLYVSNNFGNSWAPLQSDLPQNALLVYELSVNPFTGRLYLSAASRGTYYSDDSGLTWQQMALPSIGPSLFTLSITNAGVSLRDFAYRLWIYDIDSDLIDELVVPTHPDTLYKLGPIYYDSNDTLITTFHKYPVDIHFDAGRIARSYDRGQTWDYEDIEAYSISSYIYTYYSDMISRFVGYTTNKEILLVSNDLGETWNQRPIPEEASFFRSLVQTEERITIRTAEDIYYSEDDGTSWEETNFTEGDLANWRVAIEQIDDYIYVYIDSYLWQYDGDTWNILHYLGDDLVELCFAYTEEDTIMLYTKRNDTKLWLSTDLGDNWTEQEIEFPYDDQCAGIAILNYDVLHQRVWARTGIGLCYIDFNDLNLEEKIAFVNTQSNTKLDVYPNPFNEKITLSCTLQNPIAEVALYNILGEKIYARTIQRNNAERFVLNFDNLANGTYILKLRDGSDVLTRRVTHLK